MTSIQLPVLLESALRALLAAISVWTGLRFLRVRNLPAQKTAWGLVLVAALAMPLMMRWQHLPAWASLKVPAAILPQTNIATTTEQSSSASNLPAEEMTAIDQPAAETYGYTPLAPSAPKEDAPANESDQTAAVSEPPTAPAATRPAAMKTANFFAIAWIVYFGVTIALMLRLLWGLASTLRLWIHAKPVEVPASLEFPASIQVCWSRGVASPVNIGTGILLPADYAKWSEDKLRIVLAHERSHVRQRDFYLQLLAGVYAAVTWFSPLGWWLKHKLSELGEAISDRAGLDAASSPTAYAGLLLEFAALPRPTVTGVAMAHSSNLSQRIERLLNESSFRLAFAGKRRALLMLVLPAALIAASAMVRVEAAGLPQQTSSPAAAQSQQDQPSSQPAITGQSNPQPAQVGDSGSAQTPQIATPTPEATPAPPVPPAAAAPNPSPAPDAQPAPQAPAGNEQEPMPMAPVMPNPRIHVEVHVPPVPEIRGPYAFAYEGRGYCDANGDSYAIVGDPGTKTRFCDDWGSGREADVDKARSMAHGHFLLFRRDGKEYIVDDPAIMNQIEEMEHARDEVSEQMRGLGRQMRDAGRQAREKAHAGRKQATNIPTPDLTKEMAALDASVAALKEIQGGTVSREQLQEIQREVNAIQSRVIRAEVSFDMKDFNAAMAKFGEEQGKYGADMGKLGAQMGQLSRENNEKIKSIIDESLKDGKARPVQ